MAAYYNEFDPYAAQWLRNLIAIGAIAPGDVDERSIEDVKPDDLRGYTQCHFFAGIGVWSRALRNAGWPDDRQVWTGSCPCQPFSAAGALAGFADERHLWPAFHHLIKECRPAVVFGEQVASKAVDPWIDLVHADLEAVGYAFGSAPFPSASVGAPHIRDRNYWVAHSDDARLEGRPISGESATERPAGPRGVAGRMADTSRAGPLPGAQRGIHCCQEVPGPRHGKSERPGAAGGLADATAGGRREECADGGRVAVGDCTQGVAAGLEHGCSDHRPGPTNSFWRASDWIFCRDGKWRPVEPGTFPLVDGATSRVGRSGTDWHTPAGKEGFGHRAGRLKGYGNAINAAAAEQFILACKL